MGIVHFASVGTSPGAVTSALAYLKQNPQLKGNAKGHIAEAVVLFCSHQVYDGVRDADDFVWNTYGKTHPLAGWQPYEGEQNVTDVIQDFITDAKNPILAPNGKFYVWPLDVNNYDQCFEAIARATLALGRSDDTGKYIWANITGGTNIINSALMQVALLSRLIGKLYYTFISQDTDRKYLQPPTEDKKNYMFKFLPLIKTTYDWTYYRVLDILDRTPDDWMWGKELLNRLKNAYPTEFGSLDFEHFKNQYLNRMTGDVLDEQRGKSGEPDRPIKINEDGRDIITYLLTDLVHALVDRQKKHRHLVEDCQRILADYEVDIY